MTWMQCGVPWSWDQNSRLLGAQKCTGQPWVLSRPSVAAECHDRWPGHETAATGCAASSNDIGISRRAKSGSISGLHGYFSAYGLDPRGLPCSREQAECGTKTAARAQGSCRPASPGGVLAGRPTTATFRRWPRWTTPLRWASCGTALPADPAQRPTRSGTQPACAGRRCTALRDQPRRVQAQRLSQPRSRDLAVQQSPHLEIRTPAPSRRSVA